MSLQAVRGQVAPVHHDGRAVLQAEGRHHQHAWHRLAHVIGARARADEHLLVVVKHASHLNDSVDVVLNLVLPGKGAAGHLHSGHGQPRPPHLDELLLPLHPPKLPSAEAKDHHHAHEASGQELPLLVAPDAELPVAHRSAHRTGDLVGQAHKPDDSGAFHLKRPGVDELRLAQDLDVFLRGRPQHLPRGRVAPEDHVLLLLLLRDHAGILQEQRNW
mmetsp:Transcript_40348/g.96246  ORF Transcript_40348/g.96246 Transcript_40348/m.96246 type:complete len:217 (+) Transcript_40348:489-1139(+)